MDTIAAIATATGVGGVGIVRVSGPRAIAIVEGVVGKTLADRVVVVARAAIDEVVAFAMVGPRSFTGEDVAEIHGHGGVENLKQLLGAVVAGGARVAEPGEFTRRAVENGKLDLARAEALLEVIQAGSERAWRLAQANLSGRLGDVVVGIEARALTVLAEIEGRIDFPEEGIEEADAAAIGEEIAGIAEACERLARTFRAGRAIEGGVTVALVGAVNAGKSSLLNALVGSERAIVDAAPGTTRDYVEANAVWGGVAVTVIDTAGLRETSDPIEARGIALGEARVAAADVVVVVSDVATEFGGRGVRVWTKCDLAAAPAGELGTSVVTGEGIEALKLRVLAVAGVAEAEGAEQAFLTTARQHGVMVDAARAFAAAAHGWGRVTGEVIALELRDGARALAALRGVEVGERVLDEVFARFCIGK